MSGSSGSWRRMPPVRGQWSVLAESARKSPQNALCAPLGERAWVDTPSGVESGFGVLSGELPGVPAEALPGTKEKAG